MDIFYDFLNTTGFAQMTWGNAVMIVVGLVFIALAIIKDYEPLLLVPIGFGVIVGNIPTDRRDGAGRLRPGSVLSYIYFGVSQGIFPPLIFLGIGAMTDFSTMLSNPKLVLLGAAAQMGIFLTLLGALCARVHAGRGGGDRHHRRGGRADGDLPGGEAGTDLLGAIAIAAYSYMALVPVIQPPIMKLLTTREERLIRMKPPRQVSPSARRSSSRSPRS